jgi:hypothetical protein
MRRRARPRFSPDFHSVPKAKGAKCTRQNQNSEHLFPARRVHYAKSSSSTLHALMPYSSAANQASFTVDVDD